MAIKPQFIARLLKVKQRPNQNKNKQMHQINTAKSFGIFFCLYISSVECKTKYEIRMRKKIILKLITIEKQKYVHHRLKQTDQ